MDYEDANTNILALKRCWQGLWEKSVAGADMRWGLYRSSRTLCGILSGRENSKLSLS